MDTSTPEAKRPKLTAFGRSAHVTARGLSALFNDIRTHGVPDATSRFSIMQARRREVFAETPHGTLLRFVDAVPVKNKPIKVALQVPAAALYLAAQEKGIAVLLRDCLDSGVGTAPQRPLRFCLYGDEIIPNDQLKSISRRMEAMYWTVLDFGDAIVQEDAWLTLTTTLTDEVQQMQDGCTQLYRIAMQSFYGSVSGSFRDGILLKLGDAAEEVLVFGEIAMLVGDERALKDACGVKGSSGTRTCPLHSNVLSHRSPFLPDPTGFHVASTELDPAKLRRMSDATVRAALRRVEEAHAQRQAGLITKEAYDDLQQWLGFNRLQFNPFADPALNLGMVNILCYDWMHVYFAQGVFDGEVSALLSALPASDREGLREYLHLWVWPKAYASGRTVMDKGRLDGNASQLLSFAPVFGRWLTIGREGFIAREFARDLARMDSALALVDVADALQLSLRGLATPELIDKTVIRHLQKQQEAYGTELWKWKNHAATHLAEMMRRHGRLVPCFLQEKKHKVAKAHAAPRVTQQRFSMGVLEEVTLHQLHQLRSFQAHRAAVPDPKPASVKMKSAVQAALGVDESVPISAGRIVVANNRSVVSGDVVVMQEPHSTRNAQ